MVYFPTMAQRRNYMSVRIRPSCYETVRRLARHDKRPIVDELEVLVDEVVKQRERQAEELDKELLPVSPALSI